MMLKEESKKQLITRATQYGVDPKDQTGGGGASYLQGCALTLSKTKLR